MHGPLRVLVVALCATAACRHAPRRHAPRDAATTRDVARDVGWREASPGVRWREVEVAPPPPMRVTDRDPATVRWTVIRLDLSRVTLVATRSGDDRTDPATSPAWARVAVNGGFFEPDHSPSGWLVSEGALLHGAGERGGSGVLVVDGGRAAVVPSADAHLEGARGLAVQCGPRLVEADGSVGIHRDDGHRDARTVACVRDGGRTLDLVLTWDPADPRRGPGLLQLAQMLAAPSPVGDAQGCEAALNLDGGPSTAGFVRGGFSHAPVGPTPWLLAVRDGP